MVVAHATQHPTKLESVKRTKQATSIRHSDISVISDSKYVNSLQTKGLTGVEAHSTLQYMPTPTTNVKIETLKRNLELALQTIPTIKERDHIRSLRCALELILEGVDIQERLLEIRSTLDQPLVEWVQ